MPMYEALIEHAKQARMQAYTPYSHFNVGAAVRTRSGKIFQGCNIENSSYGATICAERVALFQAYAHGEREIEALVIVADTPTPCPPCGICRQVIVELAGDIDVILVNLRNERRLFRASELLPEAFTAAFF